MFRREQVIEVRHAEPYNGVAFQDGQISVRLYSGELVKADQILTQTHYTKKNGGEKVLNRIEDIAVTNMISYLISKFEAILAIDTNTKEIRGDKVSTACVLENNKKMTIGNDGALWFRRHRWAFKNCPVGESEKYSWFRLIRMITSSPNYSNDLRFAVITDHDRDRHSSYNAGELPIYRDFYLPNNFTMIYASSDAGKENVLNRLIMECDKQAKALLREYE